MVQEIRNIILSLNDVQIAFEGYQRVTPDFLPNSRIKQVSISKDFVVLTLEDKFDNTHKLEKASYNGIEALRPLIRYCIENNIILPREGQKSIQIGKEDVTIHIELDLNLDHGLEVTPMRVNNIADVELVDIPKKTSIK